MFDSGVGGLSILHEVRRVLPSAHLVYLADSKYAPYGDRPPHEITGRAVASTEFLLSRGADAVVVACNTATEIAIDHLRSLHSTPIVGLEPALKPAAAHTRSGVVGILATSNTLASEKYSKLVSTHGGSVRVISRPCPGLVERVEAGDLESSEARSLVARYVSPLVEAGADTIVLGCTHYPFLLDLIRSAAGPGVTILESSGAVARQLRRRLVDAGFAVDEGAQGTEEFWTTGNPQRTGPVLSRLWGRPVALQAAAGAHAAE